MKYKNEHDHDPTWSVAYEIAGRLNTHAKFPSDGLWTVEPLTPHSGEPVVKGVAPGNVRRYPIMQDVMHSIQFILEDWNS